MGYESNFNFDDFARQFEQRDNPFQSRLFNPNYQQQFDDASASYNPQQHGSDFGAYFQSQGPSQYSQLMGALMQDYNSAEQAEAQRQSMFMQGGQEMQNALAGFMPGIQEAMEGFSGGMQGVMGEQRDALSRFLQEGQGSLESLQGEYDAILGAGSDAAAGMREEGEILRGQGEKYYEDMTGRADQALKDFKKESKQARQDFNKFAGKAESSINTMLEKAQEGFDKFEVNGLAQLAAEKSGHDAQMSSQMDALNMSNLPPEQKAAMSQQIKMESAAKFQGTAAKSHNMFQGMRMQANAQLVGAFDSAGKVFTQIASSAGQLGAALADGMNKASAISGGLAESGAKIGAQMDMAAAQQFTQASLVEFDSQVKASGLQSQIEGMRFDMEQSALQMNQFIGSMGAQSEQFVASTLANAESLQLQGSGQLANYMASFVANPTSMADVILSGMQASLIGQQAGFDMSQMMGARFGAMGQGQSGQQFFGGPMPGGPGPNQAQGFSNEAMMNLSQLLSGAY